MIYFWVWRRDIGSYHKGQSGCPGGGVAKDCEKKGGERLLLTYFIRKLRAAVNFTPASFELPAELETEGD